MFSCFSVPVKKHEEFCINVIKCGDIPKHVAFILDGNRRYGKKFNMDLISTYTAGANKGFQVLDWCLHLGVEEITVFVLSIHNLERGANEVSILMGMLQLFLDSVERDQDKFKERGIQLKIKGNFLIFPDNIKERLTKIDEKFMHSKKLILNIAMFYTSHDEITRAVLDIVSSNHVKIEDVNERLISKHLLITRNVDLLIRTSGETRLSNFLLWQTSKAYIAFEKNLWPEFSLWAFVKIILRYQRTRKTIISSIVS